LKPSADLPRRSHRQIVSEPYALPDKYGEPPGHPSRRVRSATLLEILRRGEFRRLTNSPKTVSLVRLVDECPPPFARQDAVNQFVTRVVSVIADERLVPAGDRER